ncbi:MAG: sulfatase-like hydrolase/transferase [bacterium]
MSADRSIARPARPSVALAVGACAVGAAFAAVSFLGTPSRHDPLDVALLSLAWLLVGVVASATVLTARTFGRWPGAVAASGTLAVWAAQLREAVRPPGTPATLSFATSAALAGAVATLTIALAHRFLPELETAARRRLARIAVGASLAWVALTAGAYRLVPTFRWHVLQHDRLVGVLLHHAFDRSVASIEDALWSRMSAADPAASRVPGPPPVAEPATGTPPNLVIVLVDCLRADALPVYGADPASFPATRARLERGLVFEDVMASTTWTRASVASLFTGKIPEHHGAVDWDYLLAEDQPTLAAALRDRGYRTGAFIATRHAVNGESGFARGFDAFHHLTETPYPYARAATVTDDVLRWLDELGAERAGGEPRPVFAYVHYLDPHTPYLSGGPRNPARPAAARRGYQAELAYLDGHLARLLAGIASRLTGPTRVLITADHGEELGEHGGLGHGHTLHRELLHVPAVLLDLAPASARPAGLVAARLELRDFHDLFLSLAANPDLDASAWGAAHARELRYASLYHSKRSKDRWFAFLRPYRARMCMRAVESAAETLVWSAYGDTFELYDHGADPGELRNLVRARPDSVRALAGKLDEVAAAPWAARITTAVSAEDETRLRALGYAQ